MKESKDVKILLSPTKLSPKYDKILAAPDDVIEVP